MRLFLDCIELLACLSLKFLGASHFSPGTFGYSLVVSRGMQLNRHMVKRAV